MKDELSKEEIYFLARVKKISVDELTKVKAILDPKRVRAILIRYEYRERAKGDKIAKGQIVKMLMKRYGVSRSCIESALYTEKKKVAQKACLKCGEMTSYYRWVKYDGRCKKCMKGEL